MSFRFRFSVLLSLTWLVATSQVTTYRFTGTVAIVGGDLGSTVQVGNAFQADFVFDEAAAFFNDVGTTTVYKSTLSEISIFTSGSGTLTWSLASPLSDNTSHGFSVTNNGGFDGISFSTPGGGPDKLTGPLLNSYLVSSLYFNIRDTGSTVFSSEAIPASLSLASFNFRQAYLYFNNQFPGETITFTLTNIEKNPSAIPEPSAYAAVFGGLALVGVIVSRRHRRA
jgi:hypothetical protein